jgi:hypothetical protein
MTAHRADAAGYDCWLGYPPIRDARTRARWALPCGRIALSGTSDVLATALSEARLGLSRLLPARPLVVGEQTGLPHVLIAGPGSAAAGAVLRDLAIPTCRLGRRPRRGA